MGPFKGIEPADGLWLLDALTRPRRQSQPHPLVGRRGRPGIPGAFKSLLRAAKQRLFRVLRGKASHGVGPTVFFQLRLAQATTDETNVAEVPTRIGFQRLD